VFNGEAGVYGNGRVVVRWVEDKEDEDDFGLV
jgi:hypothetical protein